MTADFLEKQPEILFEASSLHEVCHVMNDDLTGYHRNGANIEAAEEHCVLQAIGESRYKEYLRAYATYQNWDTLTYERVLQKVKDVRLVPAPSEIDEADRIAAEYFRTHADGKEYLLVFNGDLHDVWSLAMAHARSGEPSKISGYLGKSDKFDNAVADFSVAYADQGERDYKILKKAVRNGRLEIEQE